MRILVTEPGRLARSLVTAILVEDGHEVHGCESAEAALEMLRSGAPVDVLITAVEFPGMSGLELCWEAKMDRGTDHPLYVIVMSSSNDENKLSEALDSGADEFIRKPPKQNELLARMRAASRLLMAQRELIRPVSRDSLTDLRNRRSFFEEVAKLQGKRSTLSVVMLDIDHFKKINDNFGHDAGDDVLREFACRTAAIEPTIARLGGEEFALIVEGSASLAMERAEILRKAIAASPIKTSVSEIEVTASIGVAEHVPGRAIEDAIRRADVALYASKAGGRNRVTLAGHEEAATKPGSADPHQPIVRERPAARLANAQ